MASMEVDNPSMNNTSQTQAPQACSTCRKQKRRCDKQLPSCGLCTRIGRQCEYGEKQEQTSASPEDFAALQQRVRELEKILSSTRNSTVSSDQPISPSWPNSENDSLSGCPTSAIVSNDNILSEDGASYGAPSNSNQNLISSTIPPRCAEQKFPSMFFLDGWLFSYGGYRIPPPMATVPPSALTTLGTSVELRAMVEQYFVTTHTYFPIISKVRLYQHLANPSQDAGAEVALLFLAMKLSVTYPPHDSTALTPLYQQVKTMYYQIEAQNAFTIQTIQALLLVALYEVGHAIYPAAYITTGHAGRLLYAMGLHNKKTVQMLTKETTWTAQEERRRVHWAAFILDRFVNIGHRHRPLAVEEPRIESKLPTDDEAWDRGQLTMTAPINLSASSLTSASSFARTCQAAYLLGKVVQHANDEVMSIPFQCDEAMKLEIATTSLLNTIRDEIRSMDLIKRATCFTAEAICLSALSLLYDKYSCGPELETYDQATGESFEQQLQVHKNSIEGIAKVTDQSLELGRSLMQYASELGLCKISPFVLDSLYNAGTNYTWYYRESSDARYENQIAETKEILTRMNTRWKVAGEVMGIIDTTGKHYDQYLA